ncbi:MAG: sulfurtransferase TusA family protein [Candidatus Hydrothermia bacterium]
MSAKEEVLFLGWSDCSSVLEDIASKLRGMTSGERLRVFFSNQDFAIDISAWCHETGNRLVDLGAENDRYFAVIEKA